MHVHASDSKLTEESSAKFFVKDNYQAMYDKWQEYSKTSFYIGK